MSQDLEVAFHSLFDMVDKSEVTKIELRVGQGLPEWRDSSANTRKYTMGFMEGSKTMLANLSEVQSKEINKTLLDDIYKIATDLEAEELYVALSLSDPNRDKIVRNLIIYGFERTGTKKFVTNPEIVMLKIDVNQEYDFVDLQ